MCSVVRGRVSTILKSFSKCIFENLAFEEHIFRTHNVQEKGELLLMWSNKPAVVIGRHQNTWTEVNIPYTKENNIEIARRHSGGGTVYHDLGNLNISLLTTHVQHCRPKNLKFISDALNANYNVNVLPNKRDDMELHPGIRKCSGTAARIAKGMAYHHLTLLVDADLDVLSQALRSPYRNQIETNATQSVRASAVGYLKQDDSSVTVSGCERAVQKAYQSLFEESTYEEIDVSKYVKTDERIHHIYRELQDYHWVYGKSPKFTFKGSDGQTQVVKNGLFADGKPFSPF